MTKIKFNVLSIVLIGALFVLPAIFFVAPWLKGNVYTSFDLSHITVPIEDLYARYQHAGRLPVWTPEFQTGSPMMANGIESFLYLPHLILRQWLPGIWVANFSLLLHMWLASVGMWLLLRYHKFSKTAALAGALIFAMSGYFIGRITLPQIFLPAAWLPLIILTFKYWWDKPTARRAILFAAVVSAQIISGHIQMAIYTGILLLVLGLVTLLQYFKLITQKRIITLILALIMMWGLTAVHIFPVAELLPISKRAIPLEGEEAFDVSYPASQILTWFTPTVFGNQATYVGAKNEPELLIFFGITGIWLGLIGLLSRRVWKDWLGLSAVVLIVISFILALGGDSPIYRFLHTLPVMSGMANPGRAIVLIHLSWSIFVGYGLLALQEWGTKVRRRNVVIAGVILAVILAGLLHILSVGQMRDVAWNNIRHQSLYLLVVGLICLFIVAWPKKWTSYSSSFLVVLIIIELIQGGRHLNPVMPVGAYLSQLRIASLMPFSSDKAPRTYAQNNFDPIPGTDFQPNVGLLLSDHTVLNQTVTPQLNNLTEVRVWLTWNGRPAREGTITLNVKDSSGNILRQSSVSALQINDDEYIPFTFAPLAQSKQPLKLELTTNLNSKQAPRIISFGNLDGDYNPTGILSACNKQDCQATKTDSGYGLDLAFKFVYKDTPHDMDREMLVPTFGEGFGYDMISGHLQLQLLPITRYMFELGERDNTYADKVLENRTLLDRMSVGTIVADYPENRSLRGFPDVELRGVVPVDSNFIHVYTNQKAWPRLGVASNVRSVGDAKEALRLLVQKKINEDTVTVQNFTPSVDLAVDKNPVVKMVKDFPMQVVATVSSKSSQLLVLRDAMYPGWQAYVDSTPTPIYVVDSVFRGVLVPSGSHKVTFDFVSRSFNNGAIISSIAWLIVVCSGLPWLVQASKRVIRHYRSRASC